jgi:hypothetical protein
VAAGRARGSRPRRVSLPGVAELLRPVGPGPASDSGRQASGREAHPQKITVYLSADEFLDLERARLGLRIHGIGVDRGRLVREAIAVLIADLEAGIDVSVIARRLRAAGRPDPADATPGGRALAGGSLADRGALNGGLASSGPAVAPVGVAPVGVAPVGVAPVGVAPAGGELVGGELVSNGSFGGALINGDPVSAALASSGPVGGGVACGGPAGGGPPGAQ